MASVEQDANNFTVNELKEILRAMRLSTQGVKTELIARLFERDPTGGWMSRVPRETEEAQRKNNGGMDGPVVERIECE